MGRLDDLEKRLDERLAALDRRVEGRLAELGVKRNTGEAPAARAGTAPEASYRKGMCRRIGLSVGLDHYEGGWCSPLNGCVTDATDFHRILSGAGLDTTLLTEDEASRKRVVLEIGEAARRLSAGDLYVMAISGHGGRGQLPGDQTPHESWCLWDGGLADTAVVELFSQFAAGVRIVLITDQCHSGGVLLPPESPEKGSGAPGTGTFGTLRGFADLFGKGRESPMLIQLAACRGRESSYATDIGSRWITALIKSLAVTRELGWREWFDQASSHETLVAQTPQWVELGPVTDEFRDGRVFE